MNCRPGDMAMIIRCFGDPDIEEMLGITMTVVSIHDTDPDLGARWLLEEDIIHPRTGEAYSLCADIALMPINRPDDSLPAVDKTLNLEYS